jgi:hypothetical protein
MFIRRWLPCALTVDIKIVFYCGIKGKKLIAGFLWYFLFVKQGALMRIEPIHFILVFFLVLGSAPAGFAELESANYRITTSELTSAGPAMTSTSYQINSTLGQPSPLMDPDKPPYSKYFSLYPGFWGITLEVDRFKPLPWQILLLGD